MITCESIERRGLWTQIVLNKPHPLVYIQMDNVLNIPIIYKYFMNIVVGHSCCYDQCITVRIMYPSDIYFCEDVFRLSSGHSLIGTLLFYVYVREGTSCFFSLALWLSLATCAKDCQDFSNPFLATLLWLLIGGRNLGFIL